MNRIVTLLFLIAVACMGAGCAGKGGAKSAPVTQNPQQEVGTAASTGVPSMQVPETSFDFGEVKDTEGEVVHEFKIKNVGTGTLRLLKVLPG